MPLAAERAEQLLEVVEEGHSVGDDHGGGPEAPKGVRTDEGFAQAGIDPQPAETRAEGRQLLVPVRADGDPAFLNASFSIIVP